MWHSLLIWWYLYLILSSSVVVCFVFHRNKLLKFCLKYRFEYRDSFPVVQFETLSPILHSVRFFLISICNVIFAESTRCFPRRVLLTLYLTYLFFLSQKETDTLPSIRRTFCVTFRHFLRHLGVHRMEPILGTLCWRPFLRIRCIDAFIRAEDMTLDIDYGWAPLLP